MSRTDEDTMRARCWLGSGINTRARFSPTDLTRGVRQGWSKQFPAWQLGRCEQQDQTDSPISSLSGVSFTLNGARVLKSCFHRYWGVNRTGQETLERLFVLCPEKRWMKKKRERERMEKFLVRRGKEWSNILARGYLACRLLYYSSKVERGISKWSSYWYAEFWSS